MTTFDYRDRPVDFAGRVITWQARDGRHDLPWQRDRDPYRIWVSEVMLQQTQVETVIGYYERFMARFPTVDALAEVDFDAVAALWSGLGYYARARNLHAAAKRVVGTFGGCFPTSAAALETLPGVGRSTASAIAVFAFGERAAILDGNVKRVLCRHRAIDSPIDRSETLKILWTFAEALLPERDVERYTQGLMDLGAGVCVRRRPLCGRCPVQSDCLARERLGPTAYPVRSAGRAKRVKETVLLVARRDDGALLLEKRDDRGVWGGLWSFPELSRSEFGAGGVPEAAAVLGASIRAVAPLPVMTHSLTHFKLILHPYLCEIDSENVCPNETASRRWLTPSELNLVGLPRPTLDLCAQLFKLSNV